jgi:hypothetical protein
MSTVYTAEHSSPLCFCKTEGTAQETGVNRTTRWEYQMLMAVTCFLLDDMLKVRVQVMLQGGEYLVGR